MAATTTPHLGNQMSLAGRRLWQDEPQVQPARRIQHRHMIETSTVQYRVPAQRLDMRASRWVRGIFEK